MFVGGLVDLLEEDWWAGVQESMVLGVVVLFEVDVPLLHDAAGPHVYGGWVQLPF